MGIGNVDLDVRVDQVRLQQFPRWAQVVRVAPLAVELEDGLLWNIFEMRYDRDL